MKGATSESYGIEVAKMAGLPEELTARAGELLGDLEEKSNLKLAPKPKQTSLSLTPREEKLTKALQKIDPEQITPIEALQKIVDLKKSTSTRL